MEQDGPEPQAAREIEAYTQDGVWPPPPIRTTVEPLYYPFRFLYLSDGLRDSGHISDFRDGNIAIAPDALTIRGNGVVSAEIHFFALLICFFLFNHFLPLIVGAHVSMRYGAVKLKDCRIPWDKVRRVVLVPGQSRICIVYDDPNRSQKGKTFSMAFSLRTEIYQSFVDASNAYAPGRVAAGVLLRPGMFRTGSLGTSVKDWWSGQF